MISLEYLAGYFDGEGCIHVFSEPPFGFTVVIKSGDEAILNEFKTAFGGTITYVKNRAEHHKPLNSWQINGVAAQAMLSQISPFLRSTKRIQADLVQAITFGCSPKGRGMRIPREELEKRAFIELLVRKCKHIGCAR